MKKTERPLWYRRLMLVLASPVLLAVALFMAAREGWKEFCWEILFAWRDVVDIWKDR
jgi:hypothetical protein